MVEVCRGFTRWSINRGDSALTLPVAEIPGFETSRPSDCVLKDKRTPPVMVVQKKLNLNLLNSILIFTQLRRGKLLCCKTRPQAFTQDIKGINH